MVVKRFIGKPYILLMVLFCEYCFEKTFCEKKLKEKFLYS